MIYGKVQHYHHTTVDATASSDYPPVSRFSFPPRHHLIILYSEYVSLSGCCLRSSLRVCASTSSVICLASSFPNFLVFFSFSLFLFSPCSLWVLLTSTSVSTCLCSYSLRPRNLCTSAVGGGEHQHETWVYWMAIRSERAVSCDDPPHTHTQRIMHFSGPLSVIVIDTRSNSDSSCFLVSCRIIRLASKF